MIFSEVLGHNWPRKLFISDCFQFWHYRDTTLNMFIREVFVRGSDYWFKLETLSSWDKVYDHFKRFHLNYLNYSSEKLYYFFTPKSKIFSTIPPPLLALSIMIIFTFPSLMSKIEF